MREGRRVSVLGPCYCLEDNRWGYLSHTHALRAGSPAAPTSRPSSLLLLKGDARLGVLQPVRVRDISPAQMTSGPASLLAFHWWQGVRMGHLFLTHINEQQTSCGAGGSSTLALSAPVHLSPHHQSQLFCAAQVKYKSCSLECCS